MRLWGFFSYCKSWNLPFLFRVVRFSIPFYYGRSVLKLVRMEVHRKYHIVWHQLLRLCLRQDPANDEYIDSWIFVLYTYRNINCQEKQQK